MMKEQVFALLNHKQLHNINSPKYYNLGLGHAFRILHRMIKYDITN